MEIRVDPLDNEILFRVPDTGFTLITVIIIRTRNI